MHLLYLELQLIFFENNDAKEKTRLKLKEYGIAPPVNASSKMSLFGKTEVEFFAMHNDHSDYRSGKISVKVENQDDSCTMIYKASSSPSTFS